MDPPKPAGAIPEVNRSTPSESVTLESKDVVALVQQYRFELETGETPDRQELLGKFPEIADELSACLESLEFIYRVAPQLQQTSHPRTGRGEPMVGEKADLGDFRIVREIGRGGMGVVYEARQLSLGRRVALKVLPFAVVLDDKQLRRFKNEAQVAAYLSHQNIVPVFSVGCERGVHYYAMQYIEGRTLAETIVELRQSDHSDPSSQPQVRLWERGKDDVTGPRSDPQSLPMDTELVAAMSTERSVKSRMHICHVAQLGMQAADALEYAHSEAVIHRDIKPSNLILDNRGKLWITDFGLARIEAAATLTMTGDLLGTLRYMSPEQAHAQHVVVDHRTDIYSLGATLYELLTLRSVHDGKDRNELLRQIASEEPVSPRRINSSIPTDLQTIVLKTLEKNPLDRYDTAGALAGDLRRFLEDRPVLAKPPSVVRRIRKWAQRNASIVASGILLLMMLVIGLCVSTWVISHERNHALKEKAETERQLRIATSLRLAAQSQSVRDQRPIQSLLVAMAATRTISKYDEGILPLAQENLREALSAVGGQPLLDNDAAVSLQISADGTRMATARLGEVRIWDLTKPWTSSVVLRGLPSSAVVRGIGPSGRWVVTSKSRNEAELNLWDLQAADPLIVLRGHTKQIHHALFGRDGRLLVTAGRDSTARLWNLEASDPGSSSTVLHHDHGIHALALSPDSRWLVGDDRLWDLTADDPDMNGVQLPARAHERSVRSVAFCPNSRWLAVGFGVYGANHETAVKLWDLSADDPWSNRIELPGDRSEIEVVKFSPNGRWLVAAGSDPVLRLWDLRAEEIAASQRDLFHSHSRPIWDVDFSSDSQLMVTASSDQTARVWNLSAEDPTRISLVLRGHESRLGKARFAPGNEWVITASWLNNEARKWEISAWTPAFHVESPVQTDVYLETAPDIIWSVSRLHAMRLIGDTDRLFVSSHGEARIWDLSRPVPSESVMTFFAREFFGAADPCWVSVSRDGSSLSMANLKGEIAVWDLASETADSSARLLRGDARGIPVVGWSHDGRWLAATSRESEYRRTVQFGPRGRWLATAGGKNPVSLWDLTRGVFKAKPYVLRGAEGPSGSDVSESRMAATNSDQYLAHIWRLDTADPTSNRLVLAGHSGDILTLAISPDARWIATGSAD